MLLPSSGWLSWIHWHPTKADFHTFTAAVAHAIAYCTITPCRVITTFRRFGGASENYYPTRRKNKVCHLLSNYYSASLKLVMMIFFFDVLLTVHLSIFTLVINQLDAQNLFYNKFISCFYMFRAQVLILRRPSGARDGHLQV